MPLVPPEISAILPSSLAMGKSPLSPMFGGAAEMGRRGAMRTAKPADIFGVRI